MKKYFIETALIVTLAAAGYFAIGYPLFKATNAAFSKLSHALTIPSTER